MSAVNPTVVVVPGLRGAAPDHWQELYLAEHPEAVRVPFPAEADWHDLNERIRLLQNTIDDVDGPVVLLAHSAGVLVTVAWAGQAPTSSLDRVAGAVLATPPDFDVDWPEPHPRPAELAAAGWAPTSRRTLPFGSVVAASRNDPLAGFRTTAGLAEVWGSRLVDLGDAEHLNPAAGFGPWALAEELVAEMAARLVAGSV